MDSVIAIFTLPRKSGNKGIKGGNFMISANDRMHPMVKAGITRYLRELGATTIKDTNVKNIYFTPEKPCDVTIKVFAPTKRRMDAPNWYPTVKALLDGMTDANLWSDDNNDVIKRTIFEYGGLSGTKEYRLEITISSHKTKV